MQTYLDLAKLGKNDWWRYVLGVFVILGMWQVLGALPTAFLLVWAIATGKFHPTGPISNDIPGVNPLIGFVAVMFASVTFIIGLFLVVRFLHRRPFRTLVTSRQQFDWVRSLQGFGLWFIFSGLTSLLEALLHPGRYIWTFDLKQFLPFAILALALVPIQTSAEELFFRSYILQGIGLRLRNIWALSGISGVLFMLPHFLNPEASVNYALMGLFYFSMGAFLAFMTLQDGGLELALGVHAANNLFSFLIANYTITVMHSPSIFTVTVLDPVYSVLATLAAMAIILFVLFGPLRRKASAAETVE